MRVEIKLYLPHLALHIASCTLLRKQRQRQLIFRQIIATLESRIGRPERKQILDADLTALHPFPSFISGMVARHLRFARTLHI